MPPTTWALIPIKASGQGKTRLAGVLSPAARERLVDAMLAHVLGAVQGCALIERTLLLGPSRHGIDPGLPLLDEPGEGLNAALESALAQVCGAPDRPDRLIVVAADLPCLTPHDLDLLAAAPSRTVAIAPDRHGIGTNALSLPLPEAAAFRFHYGEDSAARHREEAKALGLNAETILGAGLEKDIDEPADLADAGHVFSSLP